MSDWKIIPILIGIFGALLGVYFREALREANNKLKIAIRLEAYLRKTTTDILNSPNRDLLLIALAIKNKELEAYKTRGPNAFLQIAKEHEDKLKNIKDYLDKDLLKKTLDDIKKFTDFEIQYSIATITSAIQGILNNQIFISDQDATSFNWAIAGAIINTRIDMMNAFEKLKELILYCKAIDQPNEERVISIFQSFLISSVNMFKNFDFLMGQATLIRKKSLLRIVYEDFKASF